MSLNTLSKDMAESQSSPLASNAKLNKALTLSSLSMQEARKAIGKLARCERFTGEAVHWKRWQYLYVMSLDGTGHNFSTLLQTATFSKDKATQEEVDVQVVLAKAILNQLLCLLPEKDQVIAMNMAGWTAGQAGLKVLSSNGLGNEVKSTDQLMEVPHPSTVWKSLLARYEPNTAVHSRQALEQFCQLRMDGDFEAHVVALEQCVSRLSVLGEKIGDRIRLSRLLSSLPSSAEPVVARIDSDPSATYENAVAELQRLRTTKGNGFESFGSGISD